MSGGTLLDPKPADSVPSVLVDRLIPAPFRPFARLARLDRPIGWWLLLLPCWWSAALASASLGTLPTLWHYPLFLIGAVVMRGAGSTWNDIVDRDIDGQVARTRNRPIPSGAVSVKQAFLFMGLLCLVGLAILLTLNPFAILLGFASLAPVIIYPFMKRFTNHPQVVLGIAFAWGGLLGWAAVAGALSVAAVLIYLAAIAWTVGYDTIYALQDIDDDPGVGIGSTALAYGANALIFIRICYGIAAFCIFMAIGLAAPGPFAWAGALAFSAHLAWQVQPRAKIDAPLALRLFRSNRDAGLLLAAGLFAHAVQRAF